MEDINFLEDFYLPMVADEKLLNSNAYKALKRNNIDTYELDGVPKDPDAEVLKLDPKPDEKEAKDYALNLAKFFVHDLPKDAMLNMIEGGTHALDKIGHFGEFANKLMNYPIEGQSFKNFDEKLVGVRNNIEKIRDDSPLLSELITFPMAEVPYAVPLYKKFRKMKMSKTKSLLLSTAIGGAIAYSKDATFTVDSKMARGLKEFMNIAEDTPESELYDTAWQMGEYGLTAGILNKTFETAKALKKIKKKKELVTDLAQIGAGGSVIAGSVAATKAQGDEIPPIPEPININEKPIIDASDPQVMEMGASSIIPKIAEKALPKLKEIIKPIFKSNVVEAVNKIPNKGSGNQVLGQIKNIPGVKETELKWIGLDDFLKNKKSVTKQEVSDFVNSNRIDVNETMRGGKSEVLLQDLTNKRLKFEEKWFQGRRKEFGEFLDDPKFDKESYINKNVNYDNFEFFNMSDNTYTTIPFNQVDGYFGDDIMRGLIKPNKKFLGTESQSFKISDIELEKFKLEKEIRNWRAKGSKPKFEQYTEPGGEDYTELVFSLKTGGKDIGIPITTAAEGKQLIPFKSAAHMNVRNEIAHVRFKTRDLNGKKVLTVEEMQSDFAIQAKRQAKTQFDFPFKQNWYEMVTKRLIRYGADNGFDAIAIPKGELAAKRYGQSIDKVKKIVVQPTAGSPGSKNNYIFTVLYYDDAGKIVNEGTFFNEGIYMLEEQIGAKNFKNLKVNIDELFVKSLTKDDLRNTKIFTDLEKPIIIGSGKGKAELYDKAIPSFMKKYGKKWNARVYDDTIEELGIMEYAEDFKMPVTILELTPEMKKAVQEGSQSLFEILGTLGASGVAAKSLSDSQGNNTISN